MTPHDTAQATAIPVSRLTSNFMLDPETFTWAAEQGFQNIDFYFGGRLGVLGDVPADVAAAAITFFEPGVVAAGWEGSRAVMAPADAAVAFADQAYRWADEHLPDDAVDWVRLADLAGTVVDAASPAAAPIFAGWRGLDVPEGDAKHRAVHHLNGLRELRMARHGAAVVATGLDVADAVQHKTPWMMGIFGWPEREVSDEVAVRWEQAEALTDQATAVDYAVLDGTDAEDFVRLADAAYGAIS